MNVYTFIESTLQHALAPSALNIVDESYQHNVPEGAQSHFKVTIVSEHFVGKRLLQRHRMVNALLADALNGPVHALALHTFTADEWETKQGQVADSPKCLGGEKT